MLNFLRKRKVPLLIIADIIFVMLSGFFALVLRFNFEQIPQEYLHKFFISIPIDAVITVGAFWFTKLYHRIWTFFSIPDVIRVVAGCGIVACTEISYKIMLGLNMPRSFYILAFFFMVILTSMIRMTARFVRYAENNAMPSDGKINTMIVGAGSAGNALINEFMSNRDCMNRAVCIIDDNKDKSGKYFKGIKVVGGREKIIDAAKDYSIEEIIIAMPSVSQKNISSIVEIANKTDCRVKILPEIARSLHGNLSGNIRDIDIQDIIGREQIKVDQNGIKDFIMDKVVLVTGGGGSIGSELCRQIMNEKPKKLIIFDIYENNAYEIQKELEAKYGTAVNDRLVTLIGSVRDYRKLEDLFREYRPEIIYHAAAHKHVPLMEDSPNEAVKNNCLGTLNLCMLADEYKVKNFVLISTDKAVRPTNVMGATKRICEMIIQDYARKSETRFAAVRFGNVLGSNGSVVPLFMKQIDAGGPVTVTHRDITRFFMTIPEAVSLVLQASLFASGGEIFVLNMGKPVRIYDLAESLIKLKGYRPHTDIKIDVVGLRPGEKLYEEVLMDEEGLKTTDNELIYIGSPMDFDGETFEADLGELIMEANSNNADIKKRVSQVCPTYTITDNKANNVIDIWQRFVYDGEMDVQ